jgi:tetratricopeptide (TPR) repeat protein
LVQLQLKHLRLLWVLLAVALTACTSSAPVTGPAAPAAPASATAPDSATTPPLQEPLSPSAEAKPDTSSATQALLAQSERAQGAGSLNEAIAYTERAVRISPRQADLWIRLASLELANNQPQSSIQYANKGLSLAGGRTDWQRQAWLIIADARDALGEHDAARSIRERWQTYRG